MRVANAPQLSVGWKVVHSCRLQPAPTALGSSSVLRTRPSHISTAFPIADLWVGPFPTSHRDDAGPASGLLNAPRVVSEQGLTDRPSLLKGSNNRNYERPQIPDSEFRARFEQLVSEAS